MLRMVMRVAAGLLATACVASSAGCHLLFPHSPAVEQVESCYLCSALIFRQLPGSTEEFTEQWRHYGWPAGQYQGDPMGYCYAKLGHYFQNSLSPYVGWNARNISWTAVPREKAVDCSQPSYVPVMWGGPLGAVLRWNNPPNSQASLWISLTDKNGTYRQAEPAVRTAYIDVAERTGLPDWSSGGTYIRGKEHLRFSDMFLEVATPFQLGSDVQVTKCYIQSIGTAVAEKDGTGYQYKIYPGRSKFFFYAVGNVGGETGTSSFCFTNSSTQTVQFYQAGPMTYFTLSLTLPSSELGQDMLIRVNLVKPWSQPSLFNAHQPYITLSDRQVDWPQVTLVPDSVGDVDGDLQKILWFEDFEASNEKFLGTGNSVYLNVSPGAHEITAVAYDARGAYGTGRMTLTYTPPPRPENDVCGNAIAVSPGWYFGTLAGATNDGNSICGGFVPGQPNAEVDAWYYYTAPRAGTLYVSTCGTNDFGGIDAGMDTVLSLHSGCPGTTANQIGGACNDDWPSGSDPNACNAPWPFYDAGARRDSALAVSVAAGQTVLIRVARYATVKPGVFYLLVGLAGVVPADFDGDGDVDLNDFQSFQACFNGANKPPAQPNCGSADFDHDNDVDLTDFQTFQSCFNGPNRPPACS